MELSRGELYVRCGHATGSGKCCVEGRHGIVSGVGASYVSMMDIQLDQVVTSCISMVDIQLG